MTDERRWSEDVELRHIIMLKIAGDLSAYYPVEMQLPPRLQAILQKLDNQREQNR